MTDWNENRELFDRLYRDGVGVAIPMYYLDPEKHEYTSLIGKFDGMKVGTNLSQFSIKWCISGLLGTKKVQNKDEVEHCLIRWIERLANKWQRSVDGNWGYVVVGAPRRASQCTLWVSLRQRSKIAGQPT